MTDQTAVSTRGRPRLLAALLAGMAAPVIRRRTARAALPPDFVVLLMNDARDGDQIALPQAMERLADGGTTFPNFFMTTPLCCPSRATIFTGLYPHNHGVYDNRGGPHGGWEGFAKRGNRGRTTGVVLQEAGYFTAAVGGYLNGSPVGNGPEPGWDIGPRGKRRGEGMGNGKGKGRNQGGGNRLGGDNRRGGGGGDLGLADLAAEIITEAPAEQPLLLHVGFSAPHVPARPFPPYAGQFVGAVVDRNDPAYDEADVGDKPGYVRNLRRLDAGDRTWLDNLHQRRLETLLAVDDGVAAIWDALESRGRIDDTYVFLLSDNGYLLGHHRLYGKMAPYDGSVRFPLYAFGPGFGAGNIDPRLVGNIDIAPTAVDVAGANGPEMDGRSLLSSAPRDGIVLELLGDELQSMQWPGDRTEIPRYSALRTPDHLYVEYRNGGRELYDHAGDPREVQNLLAGNPTPEAAALAAQLAARLDELRNCRGAACT